LRKYEATAADKKDIYSQELMKTLDLITDPKIKLEVSLNLNCILIYKLITDFKSLLRY